MSEKIYILITNLKYSKTTGVPNSFSVEKIFRINYIVAIHNGVISIFSSFSEVFHSCEVFRMF